MTGVFTRFNVYLVDAKWCLQGGYKAAQSIMDSTFDSSIFITTDVHEYQQNVARQTQMLCGV